MKKQFFYGLLLVLLGYFPLSHAQESLNSAGGTTQNGNGSVSYSVGQVFYSHTKSGQYIITEGVQQAFECTILSVGDSPLAEEINVNFYPNPVSEKLTIVSGSKPDAPIEYAVYTLKGELVERGRINNGVYELDMSAQPSATYILKLLSENEIIKTYKIVKH